MSLFKLWSPEQIKRIIKIIITRSLEMVIDCRVEVDVWQEAGERQKQDGFCRYRGSTANRQLAQSHAWFWHISTHFSKSLEKDI